MGFAKQLLMKSLAKSVIYGPFMAIGALIANALKRWAIEEASGFQQSDAALIACG
jgi:hypothetical protein